MLNNQPITRRTFHEITATSAAVCVLPSSAINSYAGENAVTVIAEAVSPVLRLGLNMPKLREYFDYIHFGRMDRKDPSLLFEKGFDRHDVDGFDAIARAITAKDFNTVRDMMASITREVLFPKVSLGKVSRAMASGEFCSEHASGTAYDALMTCIREHPGDGTKLNELLHQFFPVPSSMIDPDLAQQNDIIGRIFRGILRADIPENTTDWINNSVDNIAHIYSRQYGLPFSREALHHAVHDGIAQAHHQFAQEEKARTIEEERENVREKQLSPMETTARRRFELLHKLFPGRYDSKKALSIFQQTLQK